MGRKCFKKCMAFMLSASMILTMSGMSDLASAAKGKAQKKLALSKKTLTLKAGQSKKLTVKNKPAKAKLKWSTSNKKVATVKKGKVKALKKGSAKITCKVTYRQKGKKVTKKLTAKVKVTAKKTVKTTKAPATKAPVTNAPAASASASTGAIATKAPAVSGAPTASNAPAVTKAPESSAAATEVPTTAPTATPVITEPPYTGDWNKEEWKTKLVPVTHDEATEKLLKESNIGEEHQSANGITTKDNGLMRKELSSQDLMSAMSLGWNLGNQMEQSNCMGHWNTVKECETSAGNPVAKQKTFDGLKSYGVNTVRVPVAWSNFMSDDGNYTINEDLFNRVEEIINYALNDEMYVIINIHWDGGWWGMFGAEEYDAKETPIRDEAWKKYEAFWTQIANRYKEYSDHLIFEGANEELSGRLNDDYNHPEKGQSNQTGKLPKDANAIYELVNQINQKFVDIVRSTGGNNLYRHLLIPGTGNESCVIGGYKGDAYKTDGTMDVRYKMPKDTEENGHSKLSVSVHYYDPTTYGISATSTTSWGYRDSWGTDYDYQYMKENLGRLKKFTDDGYAVIIGECGCVKGYKDNVIDFTRELFTECLNSGYCPVLWDEGHYYERRKGYFAYGDVGELFAEITGNTVPELPKNAKLVNTGVSRVPIVENPNPKVVYTWEGEFMRHTGDPEAAIVAKKRGDVFHPIYHGIGYTNSITDSEGNPTDELKAVIDKEYWNIQLSTDWSKIKEPCVRIYPADNDESKGSDLQIGYVEKEKSAARFDVDYDQNTNQIWVGKYVKIDADNLKGDYPWLWITTNTYTGCSYVKIEVCDGAYNADGSEFTK